MNTACDLCKGACCKHFFIPHYMVKGNKAEMEWLEVRANRKANIGFFFDFPCPKLFDGKCSIYASRPWICKSFQVGGPACIEAIRRVHSADKAAEIETLAMQSNKLKT